MNHENKRNYSLDIIRIVAALAVVLLHCSAKFVENYQPLSAEFSFGNLFDGISRIGVPLFLMISGALFLDERKSLTMKTIFFKNVKNIAFITILWAFIYSLSFQVLFPLSDGRSINVIKFIKNALLGHYHMWYLYMIIGLYLATPFLKKIVCKENKGLVLSFIAISLSTQFMMPMIRIACKLGFDLSVVNDLITKLNLEFFNGYITYFLVGWYIVHIGITKRWHRGAIYCLGAVSLVAILSYVYFTGNYGNAYKNIGMLVFAYSVSVFLALNNMKFTFKERSIKILTKLSNLTFGVYLVHVLILRDFVTALPFSHHSGLYIIGSFVTVICGSFLFSYIVSKIPVLKKIIKA